MDHSFPKDNPYYNLSQLIIFLVLLYFDEPDCFEINNQTSFHFISDQHGFLYHVFGRQTIKRHHMGSYQWKVKTNAGFGGRIGIIDANKITLIKDGESMLNTSESLYYQKFCFRASNRNQFLNL